MKVLPYKSKISDHTPSGWKRRQGEQNTALTSSQPARLLLIRQRREVVGIVTASDILATVTKQMLTNTGLLNKIVKVIQ